MSATPLLDITTSWAGGASADALKADVGALLKSLDTEAKVEVFKVLPRPLAVPHMSVFHQAEQQCRSSEVSTILVESDFASCGTIEAFAPHIATSLSNVADGALAPHGKAVYEWRLRLCSAVGKAAKIDLDRHVRGAIVYALNLSSTLVFEDLYDAVALVKTNTKETALLVEYVDTVLLGGGGVNAHTKFLAKAGKNFFDSVSVAETSALQKARQLSLCTLLAGKVTVPLADIVKSLQVQSSEEAETYVVDAALANLIDAQINRSAGVVEVRSVMPLRFDKAALKELKAAIEHNVKFVDSLIQSYE